MQRFFSSLKICNFAAVIKLSIMESEQKTPKRSGRKGWIVVGVAVVVAVVAVAIVEKKYGRTVGHPAC